MLTLDTSGLLEPGYIVLWTVAGVLNLGAGVAMLAVRPWARLACLVVLTCDIIVSIASAILFPQGLWEGQLWATLFVDPLACADDRLPAQRRCAVESWFSDGRTPYAQGIGLTAYEPEHRELRPRLNRLSGRCCRAASARTPPRTRAPRASRRWSRR